MALSVSTEMTEHGHQLSLTWFKTSGAPLPEPREWEAAYLTLDLPLGAWEDITVTRNGAALPVTLRHLGGQIRVTVEWPMSGPGLYLLTIRSATATTSLTLTVESRKLPLGGHDAMLEDLHVHLPADVALSVKRAGGLAGVSVSTIKRATPEQELARLRRAVNGTATRPGLAALLPLVAHRPHEVLQAYAVSVRSELVKRPRPAALVQALARAPNLSGRGRATHLPDERVRPNVDVYENRLIRTCVQVVGQRLRVLRHLAVRNPALLAPVEALTSDVNAGFRQAPFLREVRDLSGPPTRLTMVLLKRPEYRAALETLLELQRSLHVTLDDPRLLEPLQNTPALYQMWCTLHVIRALTDACTAAGFILTEERLSVSYPGTLLLRVLPDGQPLLKFEHAGDGRRVVLTSEKTFAATGKEWHSISFQQRPDLVIELSQPGAASELWVLDPKYKLESEGSLAGSDDDTPRGQPKKADIDKMHAYRDAIRGPEDQRAVRLAGILYPGSDQVYGPGICAISARPPYSGSLHERLQALFVQLLGAPRLSSCHQSAFDSRGV
ncbi:DUF2357 domain-containing protein [Deinococcus sp. QL22]|uniref:DUF2357 domain-containing protein n=1 Tax=Deinococcus sp. QL22 TaxID=2939437 RepID=UPI002017827E|nr:DUF2357 domain-containing protein [Deinococcus sp. QL22]UQN08781.1 restriction endonuclease-like protein [Deinococcus sp. QL22]